jgi:hypothetical protein
MDDTNSVTLIINRRNPTPVIAHLLALEVTIRAQEFQKRTKRDFTFVALPVPYTLPYRLLNLT